MKLEISIGCHTNNESLIATVLADMNAFPTPSRSFEAEITPKTGSAEELVSMFEELLPYGTVKLKE